MKVSELDLEHLDYWAARAENGGADVAMPWRVPDEESEYSVHFEPTTNWVQAGEIIERERIGIIPGQSGAWIAFLTEPGLDVSKRWHGPTPLVAAMRAYVASKFGEEVPDEAHHD